MINTLLFFFWVMIGVNAATQNYGEGWAIALGKLAGFFIIAFFIAYNFCKVFGC